MSGCSDYFVAYDIATDTVQGYPAKQIAPLKLQKVSEGPVVPVMAPAVDMNWLPMYRVRPFQKLNVIISGILVYWMMTLVSRLALRPM